MKAVPKEILRDLLALLEAREARSPPQVASPRFGGSTNRNGARTRSHGSPSKQLTSSVDSWDPKGVPKDENGHPVTVVARQPIPEQRSPRRRAGGATLRRERGDQSLVGIRCGMKAEQQATPAAMGVVRKEPGNRDSLPVAAVPQDRGLAARRPSSADGGEEACPSRFGRDRRYGDAG